MGRPVALRFGPFDVGLVNALDPSLLPAGAMQTALNLDLAAGTLRGLYAPTTSPISQTVVTGADLRSMLWIADYQWIVSGTVDAFAMPDYDMTNAYRVSYYADGSGSPVRYRGGTAAPEALGVVPPSALTGASAGAGALAISRRYATVDVTTAGWESNPKVSATVTVTASAGITLTYPAAIDARVTRRDLYATANADPLGQMYYYAPLAGAGSGTFTDSVTDDTGLDLTQPLDWLAGGNADNTTYPYDHAIPPTLTLISDTLHSVSGGSGAPGSGIVVGAIGPVIRWSHVGYPHYWPAVNRWAAPEDTRFITTDPAQTLIFTGSTVYALTGVDDSYMTMNKLGADIGVRFGAGKTVARTPYGIVYLSRKGLMLLSGQQAIPLALDRLTPAYWSALDTLAGSRFAGAFYGTSYFLAHAAGTIVLDFSDFPSVKVTTSDLLLTALHVTPFDTAGNGAGLYVAKAADRDGLNRPYIRAWMPENGNNRGARMAWTYRSPIITADAPASDKLFTVLRVRKGTAGTVTAKIYYDGSLAATITLASGGVGAGYDWSWLPEGYCRGMEVQLEGTLDAEVMAFEVEGEVFA